MSVFIKIKNYELKKTFMLHYCMLYYFILYIMLLLIIIHLKIVYKFFAIKCRFYQKALRGAGWSHIYDKI